MDWVPRLVRSKASKLNEAIKTLQARFGRAPADAEVAAHMELSSEEFEKLLVEANAVSLVSLNKKWCETDRGFQASAKTCATRASAATNQWFVHRETAKLTHAAPPASIRTAM